MPTAQEERAALHDLVIGLDGDDTLWHNEQLFADTQAAFRAIVAHYADSSTVDTTMLAVERRNLSLFGYGVKGFMLSMIETAIEVSGAQISATDIHRIVQLGKELMARPTHLLDGVADTVARLAHTHRLVLITKGDLLHQEAKIAASGLAELFWQIEIVSEKDHATYRRILERHGIATERFVMVGNSLASDVLPVVEIGARAVHIPYHITWALEMAAADTDDYLALASLGELADLVEQGHFDAPAHRR